MPLQRVCLGVSACLLGDKVRYDGAEKRDDYIAERLARHFDLVPICPEVSIGMGVPRSPIQLEGSLSSPRAVNVIDKGIDVTAKLESFARQTARDISLISGYIFKSKSPSCGVEKVKLFVDDRPRRIGRGIFARELMRTLPLLPVIEESHLKEEAARDNFFERVFAYQRWQTLTAQGLTGKRLAQFHRRHHLTLMAHSHYRLRALNSMIAKMPRRGLRLFADEYMRYFMETLAIPSR